MPFVGADDIAGKAKELSVKELLHSYTKASHAIVKFIATSIMFELFSTYIFLKFRCTSIVMHQLCLLPIGLKSVVVSPTSCSEQPLLSPADEQPQSRSRVSSSGALFIHLRL